MRKKLNHEVSDLVEIFNDLFISTAFTELVTGAEEPLYLPKSETKGLNQLCSTYDYFSSALHEISHWCIAGKKRRLLIDFGYWYEPDGRTADQQVEFEKAEVKPQSLEWLFSVACGAPFRLSVDNVAKPHLKASKAFKQDVYYQTKHYLSKGLPDRADLFSRALLQFYQPDREMLQASDFLWPQLR